MICSRFLFGGVSKSFLKPFAIARVSHEAFSCSPVSRASSYLFSDKHEWINVEDGVGSVGISKYAAEALGDVVYAQLPESGTKLAQHDECGALESVKTVSDIYSPVSGEITAKNDKVEESPEIINQSPMQEGWLFKIKLSDENELNTLMTEEKYNEFIKTLEIDNEV